jgi:hypothetical protein
LPKPEPHDGDVNTHRICINAGEPIFDLQVNASDLLWFRYIFDALDGRSTSFVGSSRALPAPDAGRGSDTKAEGTVEFAQRVLDHLGLECGPDYELLNIVARFALDCEGDGQRHQRLGERIVSLEVRLGLRPDRRALASEQGVGEQIIEIDEDGKVHGPPDLIAKIPKKHQPASEQGGPDRRGTGG